MIVILTAIRIMITLSEASLMPLVTHYLLHYHESLCNHGQHHLFTFRSVPLAIGCYRYILVVHPSLVIGKPILLRLVRMIMMMLDAGGDKNGC